MLSSILKKGLIPATRPLRSITKMPLPSNFAASFSTSQHHESDDHRAAPRISLDSFYETVTGTELALTDEEALEYMKFASKMAMVSFKDEEEMLSFKGDFQAALAFIQKLDEVDVSAATPPAISN